MKASEKRLQEVLSLRRLQSLRCIHLQTPDLVFKLDPWHSDQKYSLKNVESRFAYRSKEAGHHLQMIRNHPSIRKLSLKTSFRGSPSEKEAAKLADILVKFDELDLTEVTWCLKLLKSMISASAGGNSKLKKLSLSDFDEMLHSEVLAKARERFAVASASALELERLLREQEAGRCVLYNPVIRKYRRDLAFPYFKLP